MKEGGKGRRCGVSVMIFCFTRSRDYLVWTCVLETSVLAPLRQHDVAAFFTTRGTKLNSQRSCVCMSGISAEQGEEYSQCTRTLRLMIILALLALPPAPVRDTA